MRLGRPGDDVKSLRKGARERERVGDEDEESISGQTES
eukprot:CAMPEP_0171373562 /NCGR_PEP_ID=MMETSP0879-20121228/12917_1 /TAXON_ID=67004 /ORGANISM="Thalassiosira weissflogii, Strain CCMP1336" /LENGTH=37 /DNA_ID= /DNA_START= /DNA_END= /DNA_ORIENTATION=